MSRALAPPASLAGGRLAPQRAVQRCLGAPGAATAALARISRDTGAGVGDETLK
eukprot:CAMPEP_0175189602 /NCGR_PEP_ID=MMETSP0093-20121207/4013_1 /TAXON_ID=311494 /ORGANISM="Alexandrium monilatum, Strain CCMP3105" /LENGTH=53 /DNA_ID=CAMNT_0016482403 /DNA_START=160 /DNA_END=322 /DNA_ORIENTATION=+